jgi:hypothetical protein
MGYTHIGPTLLDYLFPGNDILDVTGDTDGYIGLTLANRSSGTGASADFLINNDLTYIDEEDGTHYYTDLGMNGGSYDSEGSGYEGIGLPNQTYLYNSDSALSFATASTTEDGSAFINFLTGGLGTTTERMRITEDGLIGIGTSTPDAKLVIDNGTAEDGGNFYTNVAKLGAKIYNAVFDTSFYASVYGVASTQEDSAPALTNVGVLGESETEKAIGIVGLNLFGGSAGTFVNATNTYPTVTFTNADPSGASILSNSGYNQFFGAVVLGAEDTGDGATPGLLKMQDSDGAGWSCFQSLDGVLSSVTCP